MNEGWVDISPLTENCAEGTEEAVAAAREAGYMSLDEAAALGRELTPAIRSMPPATTRPSCS